MAGTIDVKSAEAKAPSGQPPRVLAAWIGEALQEVRSEYIADLACKLEKLQADASSWDATLLSRSIDATRDAAGMLDVGALKPRGFWLRLIGFRGASAYENFHGKYDELLSAAGRVRGQIDTLRRSHQSSTSAMRKLVVELELAHRAIACQIEEAVDWLAELMRHLAALPPEAAKGELSNFAATAEGSAAQLKRLVALNELLGSVAIAGHNVLERRMALLDRAKKDIDGFDKVWSPKVGQIVMSSVRAKRSVAGLDRAETFHAELISRLETTSEEGIALQIEEQGLERLVARMLERLRQAE